MAQNQTSSRHDREPWALRVECYAGYRGEQEPLAFWLGDRISVRSITDRWFAPTQRWFKVDADDGHTYVLRHDEASGRWELAAYTRRQELSERSRLIDKATAKIT